MPKPISRLRLAFTLIAAPFVAVSLLLLAGFLLARDIQAD